MGADHLLPFFTRGKSPRSISARLAPNCGQYPRPTLRQVMRDGLHYELDLSDFMEWFLYFGLEVEPRNALLDLAPKGGVVLDIGANIGETSMRLAQAAGPNGTVYSFEPSPTVGTKLRKNLSLNSFKNVKIVPLGLGSEPGSFQLVTPTEHNRGGNRISSAGTGGETIKVVTLDSFIDDEKLTRVDLIKIDVEGFEKNVLLGAKVLLQKLSPTLFIELDDANLREQNSSAKELVELLESLGYQCCHAITQEKVRPANNFTGQHYDIICKKG